MSRYSCDNCGSSDGVAYYPDGSYCYSCHAYSRNTDEEKVNNKKMLELPTDLSNESPCYAREYLNKYNIKEGQWSNSYNRLCFPYYQQSSIFNDSVEMVGCWMRGFDKDKPKWLFTGKKNFSWWLKSKETCVENVNCSPDHEKICIVEDVISGIKCNRFIDVIVLGGTKLSDYDRDILKQYKTVFIFLDGDVAGKEGAKKIRNELKLTHKCIIIRTQRDPKEYFLNDLREVFYEI